MTAQKHLQGWDERIAAVEQEADRGDARVALADAQQLAEAARENAGAEVAARALTALALAARQVADFPRALAACAEGLELARGGNTSQVRSACLLQRGHVSLDMGDYAHARDDAATARATLSQPAPP